MAASPSSTQAKGVLIVDDNPVYRRGLRRLLERIPTVAWVMESDGSDDVVAQVQHLAPAVVLLDYHLPGQKSLELVAAIRAARPRVRILVLSSEDEPDLQAQAETAGADGCMAKAVPDRVLMAWMRE